MLSSVRCGNLNKFERITGQCGLSSPQAWTNVVRAASVKLSKMDMSLACQVREVVGFDNSALFLTVGGCIKDKHYVLLLTTGVCSAHTILLHTCHSQSGHILESWFMRE